MAKYCPVAPPALLQDLLTSGHLPRYNLLLAHDILAQPKAYLDVFGYPDKRKEEMFIILDNGLIELGTAMDPISLVEAADIIGADVIQLPDVYNDMEGTVDSTLEAYDIIENMTDTPFMGVMHGKTQAELGKCASDLSVLDKMRYWAVPRVVTNDLGSRDATISMLWALDPTRHIHLLGFSNRLIDDIACARRKPVMSIDSAAPLIMGHLGAAISLDLPSQHPQRPDFYWEAHTATFDTIRNIQRVRNWIGEEDIHDNIQA